MSMLRYYTDDAPGLKITPVRCPVPSHTAGAIEPDNTIRTSTSFVTIRFIAARLDPTRSLRFPVPSLFSRSRRSAYHGERA